MKSFGISLLSGVAAVSLLVGVVRSANNATYNLQQIESISACGIQKCLVNTLPEIGCALLDTACYCAPDAAHRLSLITADCMYANCTIEEAIQLAKIQAAICDFPNASKNTKLKIMTSVCSVISYGFTFLRLGTRYLLGQRLGADDYFIVAASISDTFFIAFAAIFETEGYGEHIWNINVELVPRLLLWFWLCEIIYPVTIALVKISILFFYLRIFPKRSFRLTCYAIMGFCVTTATVFTICTVFQCTPIEYIWRKDIKGKCINYNATVWSNAAINIFQDLIILAIPISEVRHLQLTRRKKYGMYAMFSVGGLVCVLSIIRLHSLTLFGLTADPTWDNVNMTFWTALETTAAFVCACMPTCRALMVRYSPLLHSRSGKKTNDSTGLNTYNPMPPFSYPKGPPSPFSIMLSHSTRIYHSSNPSIDDGEHIKQSTKKDWLTQRPTTLTTIVSGMEAREGGLELGFESEKLHPIVMTQLANSESEIPKEKPVLKDSKTEETRSSSDQSSTSSLIFAKNYEPEPQSEAEEKASEARFIRVESTITQTQTRPRTGTGTSIVPTSVFNTPLTALPLVALSAKVYSPEARGRSRSGRRDGEVRDGGRL